MTPAGWCGPRPAATARRSRSSWIRSATSAASSSSSSPATWPSWITGPVAERCPNANVCVDPFHVVKLATDALDEIRREVWNEARRQGQTQLAQELKGARFALWKNPGQPDRAPTAQARPHPASSTSGSTAPTCSPSNCARSTASPPTQAIALLDAWLKWARRCRLQPFVKLAKHDHRAARRDRGRDSATGSRNARVEQINTQIRLITRRAFGFHSPQP